MASSNTTTAAVLGIGLALGVLGDLLFHDAGWGLNALLWIGTLVAAGWWLLRREGASPPWSFGVVLVFAAFAAWRASPFLRAWNLIALLAAGVLVSVQLRQRLTEAKLTQYLRGALAAAFHVVAGPVIAASGLDWLRSAESTRRRTGIRLAVGAFLAVPVVLVFGALLASADPVLDAFVARLFQWDVEALAQHLALVGLLSWLAAGALWALTMARARSAGGAPDLLADVLPTMPSPKLGILELGIPLGALLVLLVSFVALQTRYLFGGESLIALTGLTYAELARRGFFELVTVSALVVPVLLVSQHLLDRSRHAATESFRALVVALLIVVVLVMISALARMRLYVQSYGLTEDRLYASAFMGWVGFVLLWLAVTEVRDRLTRFATGAVLAGFGVLAVLNAVNPDGLIARTNIARAERGLELDVVYLNRLSTDAIPAIAARWQALDAERRAALRSGLMSTAPMTDWRGLTWSQLQFERAVMELPPDPLPTAIGPPGSSERD